ncbi:MAG TPA: hypothetical protein VFS21_36205 [Roseiflexaceae bacterium]|nr:hypothetical protein [Roseiflexaceae bacterium]
MTSPDLITELMLDEHRSRIADSQKARLAEHAQGGLTLARRLARPLGRAFLDLGARLLMYARPEPAEQQPISPIRSVHLN